VGNRGILRREDGQPADHNVNIDCVPLNKGNSQHIADYRTFKDTYHLRYPHNIVIAAANESNQGLPSILSQYSDAGELGSSLLKIGIRRRPLIVKAGKVYTQIEVMAN
jgi:hypothetical protein